jgi:hypothetical protein
VSILDEDYRVAYEPAIIEIWGCEYDILFMRHVVAFV